MKFSIITTCFNAVDTIRDCLESVRNQTHRPVEHIVVDAASTDGTRDLLEEYKENLAKVVSEPDNGIYDGMNKGLQLVTGDIVGILNADDMYASADALNHVSEILADQQVDSCYGDLVYFKGNKRGQNTNRS